MQKQASQTVTPKELNIGYVGGGSRDWARKLMNDLAQTTDIAGNVRLYDVDFDSARRNEALGNWIQEQDSATGEWQYTAVRDLSDALEGADVVILSTQHPPDKTMVYDLDIPERYGIYQTVGDTVGPGGVLRGMRAIPQYREIAAAVRELCPKAWVLNYTNPMTICTQTLFKEFPEINAMGLCHEVLHAQDYLCSLVEQYYNVSEIHRDEIDINVKGINHFTWTDEAYWRGHDLFTLLDAELKSRKPFPNFESGEISEQSYFTDNNEIAFDLYQKFDSFPVAGDRHLAEFVPWYLAIAKPSDIHRWGIRLTPSEYRINKWPNGDNERERLLKEDCSFEFVDSGEVICDIIRAIVGIEPFRTNVNVPNQGQISNLPEGTVVETNASITGNSLRPIAAGSLPRQIHNIIYTHIHNQETLIEAGFNGDIDMAYQAFLNDPLVTINRENAKSLFIELVEQQREYLQSWNTAESRIL